MSNPELISIDEQVPLGALIHPDSVEPGPIKVSVIDYTADQFTEFDCEKIEDCFPYRDSESVTWINVSGLHDVASIEKLGAHFNMHELIIDDIRNTSQRPKASIYDHTIHVLLQMHGVDKEVTKIVTEQLSLIIGQKYIISFQELEGDVFHALRAKLRNPHEIARRRGSDFLLYRIIDAVVDNYFHVMDHVSDFIGKLEEQIMESADEDILQRIQKGKKRLVKMRRSIYPLREALFLLEKESTDLVMKETRYYFRDVYDHVIQAADSLEIYREMANSLMELYYSRLSTKMNQVMQVLTIIATIFIPLTFIAGIYGMNFINMRELEWEYGYLAVMSLMLIITLFMLRYFRRKGWL